MLLDDSLAGAELVARFDGADRRRRQRRRRARASRSRMRFPDREVVLLEAERRKCDFLESVAPPNARVVWGRAEEQETDWAGVAVAKALAQPPTAAEWCLPLVREGGAVVLWVGPSVDRDRVAAVAERDRRRARGLAGRVRRDPQDGPTPAGFPRRTGVAKKRPLA